MTECKHVGLGKCLSIDDEGLWDIGVWLCHADNCDVLFQLKNQKT